MSQALDNDPSRETVGQGPLSVLRRWWHAARSALAITGFVVAAGALALLAQPDWCDQAEAKMLGWLLARQEREHMDDTLITPDPTAIDRVTAASPSDLPRPQANVVLWLSRRYRVAPEPLSVLVAEAFQIGSSINIDPTLILAVMAIESRFNPYAQSPVGAQGLMQVLTRVHTEKYDNFGGALAALDPVSNLRVGAQVLHDAVRRAGSIEGGLKLYVGAVTTDGSDYINKVMAEHLRLKSVAQGQPMPKAFPVYIPPPPAVDLAPPVPTDASASAMHTDPGSPQPTPAATPAPTAPN